MQVEIKNYRGVSDARLTMAPIALVAGINGAGKSSIAQAISAALTGNAAPIDGVAKNAAGQLLRDGTKRGKCVIGDETGTATVNWPGASTNSDGNPPWSSEIACGLTSIVNMRQKDAAALLIKAIDALPTQGHLKAALPHVEDDMLSQVWAAIQADGWDSAHTRAKERGVKLKGAWEHVTGERYGSAKAEGWKPTGAPEAGTEELNAALADAKAALEQALATQAVGQAEVQRLRTQVQHGVEAKGRLDALVDDLTNARKDAAQIDEALASLQQPEVGETLAECPHCQGHLVVVSRTEVRAPTEGGISDDENAKRQAAIDAKRDEQRRTAQFIQQLGAQQAAAAHAVSLGETAAAQLEQIPEGGTSAEEVQKLRDEIAETETDLRAVQAVHAAEKLHLDISANQLIIDALAPEGVRRSVLAEKLNQFNSSLSRLCEEAGWPIVKLDDELSSSLGDRPYLLLSESEKFRVRATLQVAMADQDGSEVVLIDAADILDRSGRNGLIRMTSSAGLRALICMTMNAAADVPDLAAAGLGRSYWLDDSVLEPIDS